MANIYIKKQPFIRGKKYNNPISLPNNPILLFFKFFQKNIDKKFIPKRININTRISTPANP